MTEGEAIILQRIDQVHERVNGVHERIDEFTQRLAKAETHLVGLVGHTGKNGRVGAVEEAQGRHEHTITWLKGVAWTLAAVLSLGIGAELATHLDQFLVFGF